MTIYIKGNSLFSFNRTLSNENIKQAIESSSKEKATHVGIWEKIKDWFCGTNTSEALEKIYVLTHNSDEYDTESILKKVTAFYQLKGMAYPVYQDGFKASITPNKNGSYTFTFSIKDVIDEYSMIYGDPEKDVYSIKERKLTNNSELLNSNTVIHEGLDAALSKVKYDSKIDKLENINIKNKIRMNLHLLSEKTKKEIDISKNLLQKWISLQMKCFDYYHDQLYYIYNIKELDTTKENELSILFNLSDSINNIKKHVTQSLAENFTFNLDKLNNKLNYAKVQSLYVEYFYAEPFTDL